MSVARRLSLKAARENEGPAKAKAAPEKQTQMFRSGSVKDAPMRRRILHLISARGGGMERYARDLAALTPDFRHAFLHLSEECVVLESEGLFYPLQASEPMAHWAPRFWDAFGADLIHSHHVSPLALNLLEAAPNRPLVLSIHDVGLLHPRAFAQGRSVPTIDVAWIKRWREIALRASRVLLPSRFILRLWEEVISDVPAEVLEPGVSHTAKVGEPRRSLQTIGVVGAIGPHKGKTHLLDLIQLPGAERFKWVLIGYTEDQLQPGPLLDGRLWVHGPFDHAETSRWLKHYRIDLVYFPNQIAESFSYALSDVWAAGVPVVAPDVGALGERVRQSGAGMVVPAGCEPAVALAMLQSLADVDRLSWHRRLNDANLVPDHATMALAIAPVYRAAMENSEAVSEDLAALQPMLRSQLDGVVFRSENIRLARDYGQVLEWATKLETDVQRQQNELLELAETRAAVDAFAAQQTAQLTLAMDRVAQLEQDVHALRDRNHVVESSALAIERDLHAQLARAESLTSEVYALAEVRAELEKQTTALRAELSRVEAARAATDAALARLREEFEVRFEHSEKARRQVTAEHDAMKINNAHLTATVLLLEQEIVPLRIKGARYDRVLGWVPSPLRVFLRKLRLRSQ